jgi:hypothetical protein
MSQRIIDKSFINSGKNTGVQDIYKQAKRDTLIRVVSGEVKRTLTPFLESIRRKIRKCILDVMYPLTFRQREHGTTLI